MEPEDGGYATTDEELDSDDGNGGVELDLKMWLSQLDSPAPASSTVTKMSYSAAKPSKAVAMTTSAASLASKTPKQPDIDFDSILGQLSSLDDQFNDLGDDESSWSPSKPLRPAADESKAPAPHSNSNEFKYTEIADDFGDISSHLLDVISELDQLVDSNVGSESKPNRSSVEAHRASLAPNVKEVNQFTVGPGHGRDPHPPLHKPLLTDGKRPMPEIVKNQKPSNAVRTSVKSDVCSREEGSSLRSSSDSGSSSSVTQSVASSRLSGRSAAFETLPQVCVKVFSPDGGSKSLLVDECTSVGRLCEMLVEKNLLDRNRTWGLTEQLPDLFMQRLLEDHQFVLKEIHEWPKETNNRLVFLEAPKKYEMFDKSQILDESRWEPTKLDGWLHLKADGKKAWKKWNCILQNGGIYYNTRGKGKTELTCVKHLNDTEVFTGVAWKKKFKAPTEFGFALKPSATQKKLANDIKYFCTDDQVTMWKWVTAIRVAKNGFQLYRNFRQSLIPPEDYSAPSGAHSLTEYIDQKGLATKPSDGTVHRVSRLSEDLFLHNDLDGRPSTDSSPLRRGSGDSTRNSITTAESSIIPSGSKMKAQIPITAQTARLLSMQPSSSIQTLPRSTSRRDSQKTPSAVNTNEQRLYAETTLATMHHRLNERGRPESPDLPPPPPELLAYPLEQPPTERRVGPPAPPRRDESTKLSFKRNNKNLAQTKNFILNLQRTIGQKSKHGAEGLVQLEMPLPPPPMYSDEPSYLDLGDLPPPPAELLEELKVMKRKSRQPPPPTPVKYATLRVSKTH